MMISTIFFWSETSRLALQVASAVFTQPPMATVGLSEEAAIDTLAGDLDIFTSSFRPMKNTVSGREEKTFMKIIVQAATDEVGQAPPVTALGVSTTLAVCALKFSGGHEVLRVAKSVSSSQSTALVSILVGQGAQRDNLIR